MWMLIGFVVWLVVSVVAFSAFLSGILAITLFGYSLVRMVLKSLGLYSATPEQFRNELRFAALSGGFFLATVACMAFIEWIGIVTGAID
jgi:hypothetical protein